MSWHALNWALIADVGDSTAKLVLILLANHADRKTASCYPSQKRLASLGHLSERSVRDALARLEAGGFIERRRRSRRTGKGGRTSDEIVLRLPAVFAANGGDLPAESAGVTGSICRAESVTEPSTSSSSSTHVGARRFLPGSGWIEEVS